MKLNKKNFSELELSFFENGVYGVFKNNYINSFSEKIQPLLNQQTFNVIYFEGEENVSYELFFYIKKNKVFVRFRTPQLGRVTFEIKDDPHSDQGFTLTKII